MRRAGVRDDEAMGYEIPVNIFEDWTANYNTGKGLGPPESFLLGPPVRTRARRPVGEGGTAEQGVSGG